ncbi:hypothetical protein ACFY3U_13630 [Micromonospora sp. NPDC000089]|uniref:hypothetical protein n=1 Tax=unclassified Micromonospora TaxID=2617518 RepID=UPI0036B84BA7
MILSELSTSIDGYIAVPAGVGVQRLSRGQGIEQCQALVSRRHVVPLDQKLHRHVRRRL